jgi:hypothetical protein
MIIPQPVGICNPDRAGERIDKNPIGRDKKGVAQ